MAEEVRTTTRCGCGGQRDSSSLTRAEVARVNGEAAAKSVVAVQKVSERVLSRS